MFAALGVHCPSSVRRLAGLCILATAAAACGDDATAPGPEPEVATVRVTVGEQLVYEMGDPKSYITPDAMADFTTIRLDSGRMVTQVLADLGGTQRLLARQQELGNILSSGVALGEYHRLVTAAGEKGPRVEAFERAVAALHGGFDLSTGTQKAYQTWFDPNVWRGDLVAYGVSKNGAIDAGGVHLVCQIFHAQRQVVLHLPAQ